MRNFINSILKYLVTLALRVYYKKWEISGTENIPRSKPVIFASNHQNAFIDALLIATSMKHKPYFLARANIFQKSWAKKLLNTIRIMPIYRFRDGLGNVKKNDEVFEMCKNLLEENEAIIMFPEGNHASRWSVRPLQRGVARLAFSTEELHAWNLGLVIVPVGIQYEEQKSFRSRVYVQFGEPIKVRDYKSEYLSAQRIGWMSLTQEMEKRMKPLVLHISPQEEYDKIYHEFVAQRPFYRDFKKQFIADKELINSIKTNSEFPHKGDKSYKFYPHHYFFAGISLINNFLVYKWIKIFIHKKVKDKVFNSSLKLAFGLVLVPLYYIFIGILLYIISGNILLPAAYFLLTAISNYFGLDLLKIWFSNKKTTQGASEP